MRSTTGNPGSTTSSGVSEVPPPSPPAGPRVDALRTSVATPTTRTRSRLDPLRMMWRRRHFLVDRKSQLRASLLATATALVLLALLNISLYSTRAQTSAVILGESPELKKVLQVQNRTEFGLVIVASMVFLAGVFAVTMLETHKTAGAALHIDRKLRMILEGHYGVRLVLRRDDNLREVETTFNEMSRTLEARANRQSEELLSLAREAEQMAAAAGGLILAERLRDLARRSRPVELG